MSTEIPDRSAIKAEHSDIPKWGSMKWFQKKHQTQDHNSAASYFSHSANAYQKMRHDKLTTLCLLRLKYEPDYIVDYGCAVGDLTAAFAKIWPGAKAKGYDFVPELITAAKDSHSGVEFSTNALPNVEVSAPDKSLIILSEVLYYLDKSDRKKTLTGLKSSAKGDMTVLFTSVVGERYFTKETAEALFRECGFVPETHVMSLRRYKKLIGFCAAYEGLCAKLSDREALSRPSERLAAKFWKIFPLRWMMLLVLWTCRKISASERLASLALKIEDTEDNRKRHPNNLVILAKIDT